MFCRSKLLAELWHVGEGKHSLHQLVSLTVNFHTEEYALSIAKVRFSTRFYCNASDEMFCFNEGFQLCRGNI